MDLSFFHNHWSLRGKKLIFEQPFDKNYVQLSNFSHNVQNVLVQLYIKKRPVVEGSFYRIYNNIMNKWQVNQLFPDILRFTN